ncbi:MAG: hypothetical protein NT02SARS_1605 [SAR86 cluster bacterium SAR86B]|uniref:Transmembrane protein n=1 Tax=SAR86 cluster bacterium SAR86B TaxID=1123867 RepID=J4X0D9_9GAMM|nr:MAG: hypothetical protein NT02SARS_1605 [SAR86 cluster bacterium SAR86B]
MRETINNKNNTKLNNIHQNILFNLRQLMFLSFYFKTNLSVRKILLLIQIFILYSKVLHITYEYKKYKKYALSYI